MNKQEDFKNRVLAQLLTERGIPSDFEQRAGRKRMDVVADVEGLRVVLEAETGYHRKAQAIKDADARLREIAATFACAGLSPGFREAAADMYRLLSETPFASETPEEIDRSRTLDQTATAMAARLRSPA